jgi:hypothetical protein
MDCDIKVNPISGILGEIQRRGEVRSQKTWEGEKNLQQRQPKDRRRRFL